MHLSDPDDEIRTCTIAVGEAYLMAVDGEFVRGFDHLHLGLTRAKDRANGAAPWAQMLVRRWEREINLYCKMFGVKC